MPELETREGINISYSYHKGTKSENIVLLHGLGASKETFSEILTYPELLEYNIISMDHVGHGNSSTPEDFSFSMSDMAEHVKILLEKVTPEGEVFLILHSMGGAIGIFLAKKLGNRLKGIVFAEGNIDFDDCFFSNYIITRHSYEEWVDEKFDRILNKYKSDPKMLEYSKSFEKAGPMTLFKASVDLVKVSEEDVLLDMMVSLEVPVLGIYGDENRAKYPSEKRFREHFPVVFTSNSGHNMMVDNPDEFYDEINKFIRSI